MKVLVTGSTGFVGSHLCEQLTKDEHHVFAQARNKNKFDHFQVPGTLIEGDLSASESHQWIDRLPKDLDAIIYTVGIVHSFNSKNFYQSNALAFERFTNELKDKYTNLRIILISSMAATGPSDLDQPVNESTRCNPINHYGKSKLDAEKALLETIPESWEAIIIRPPMVIGPRDPAILDVFKMVKSRVVLYPGFDGVDNRYSFISVFDLVKLCSQGLSYKLDENNQATFFASYPETITYHELISEVAKLLKRRCIIRIPVPRFLMLPMALLIRTLNQVFKINARLTPDKAHEIVQPAWTCSSRLSIEKLQHQYQWSFQDILQKTYDDYKNRKWL